MVLPWTAMDARCLNPSAISFPQEKRCRSWGPMCCAFGCRRQTTAMKFPPLTKFLSERQMPIVEYEIPHDSYSLISPALTLRETVCRLSNCCRSIAGFWSRLMSCRPIFARLTSNTNSITFTTRSIISAVANSVAFTSTLLKTGNTQQEPSPWLAALRKPAYIILLRRCAAGLRRSSVLRRRKFGRTYPVTVCRQSS